MVAFDSALLVRKIGMVFALFAAGHAVAGRGAGGYPALLLAGVYILISFVFCRTKSALAIIGYTLILAVCAGFTLSGEPYGSILYHILLLTVALEMGVAATKRAAVAILLTFLGASAYALKAWHWQAVFLTGFNVIGFYALTYAAVHLHMLIDKKHTDDSRMKDLIDQNRQNYRMALTDGLTGLYNRRAYNEKIDGVPEYVVLVIDIDYFKRLNDTYGHAVGDKVLVKISNIIKLSVRQGDAAFRYGGEEFVIVLPGASLPLGCSIAERLRHRVAQTEFVFGANRIPVTISVGVAMRHASVSSGEAFEQADQALYRAKQSGRNQVQCHGSSKSRLATNSN